jgi:hypothetical protein
VMVAARRQLTQETIFGNFEAVIAFLSAHATDTFFIYTRSTNIQLFQQTLGAWRRHNPSLAFRGARAVVAGQNQTGPGPGTVGTTIAPSALRACRAAPRGAASDRESVRAKQGRQRSTLR